MEQVEPARTLLAREKVRKARAGGNVELRSRGASNRPLHPTPRHPPDTAEESAGVRIVTVIPGRFKDNMQPAYKITWPKDMTVS